MQCINSPNQTMCIWICSQETTPDCALFTVFLDNSDTDTASEPSNQAGSQEQGFSEDREMGQEDKEMREDIVDSDIVQVPVAVAFKIDQGDTNIPPPLTSLYNPRYSSLTNEQLDQEEVSMMSLPNSFNEVNC